MKYGIECFVLSKSLNISKLISKRELCDSGDLKRNFNKNLSVCKLSSLIPAYQITTKTKNVLITENLAEIGFQKYNQIVISSLLIQSEVKLDGNPSEEKVRKHVTKMLNYSGRTASILHQRYIFTRQN